MSSPSDLIVVEGYRATRRNDLNLRDDAVSLVLDQRAFGPRRLVVAFSTRTGRMLGLAHAPMTDPPDLALEACCDHVGGGAAAAVAYSDEPVAWEPPPDDTAARFAQARTVCGWFGIHLVDWFCCDDINVRLMKMAAGASSEGDEWWDVPAAPLPATPRPAGRLESVCTPGRSRPHRRRRGR